LSPPATILSYIAKFHAIIVFLIAKDAVVVSHGALKNDLA
jgi:hypothetical protein